MVPDRPRQVTSCGCPLYVSRPLPGTETRVARPLLAQSHFYDFGGRLQDDQVSPERTRVTGAVKGGTVGARLIRVQIETFAFVTETGFFMFPLRSPLDDGFSASISARDPVYHVGVSIASVARGAPILPGVICS
jgi:hypothetical protein